jgi:hypothetical protein
MNKFYSRKFSVAILSLLSLDILVWFGKIDSSLYITGLIATVGAYITANYFAAKE